MTREILWTLDELSAAVSRALMVDYAGPISSRVSDFPDPRTIRYYTTLGLVDRPVDWLGRTPSRRCGRTALYRRRHLLQLVAIKRLQAEGLSLAEVQARLLRARTDSALEALARVPADLDAVPSPSPEGAPAPRDERFWTAAPAPVARPLHAVPLAEGVTLLLPAARALTEHDLSALHRAAAPLLRLLKQRRLLGAEGTTSFPQGDAS
jgi:DNA-binding transcriptional MerR regulator